MSDKLMNSLFLPQRSLTSLHQQSGAPVWSLGQSKHGFLNQQRLFTNFPEVENKRQHKKHHERHTVEREMEWEEPEQRRSSRLKKKVGEPIEERKNKLRVTTVQGKYTRRTEMEKCHSQKKWRGRKEEKTKETNESQLEGK